jgi:hypothetical protein
MKYLKMLGLAAIAGAALMAFIGAGTASAAGGALCSTATNPCTSRWATPTAMEFSLSSGTSSKLTDTSGNTLDTCTSSTISGSLTSNPGGATPASGTNSSITWGGCTVTTDTILPGGWKVESGSGGSGKLTSNIKIEWTTSLFGGTCSFVIDTGVSLGTIVTGIGSAVKAVYNAILRKSSGGFLCPETTKWTAEYVLTKPSATTHYVSTS